MGSEWCKPVNVTLGDGDWGHGTVRGGPFSDETLATVTSPFGYRQAFETTLGPTSTFHPGCDLWAFPGAGVPLYALGDGVVDTIFRAEQGLAEGNSIKVAVRDSHGALNGWTYSYFHLAEPPLSLSEGDEVSAGQLLGHMGATGKVTGPHLHLEIAFNGQRLDPLPVLLAARDIGEPAPPPMLAEGDWSGLISARQSLELQYVIGKGTLMLPQPVSRTASDLWLDVEGQVGQLVPAGTLVKRWEALQVIEPEPHWLGK